MRPQRHNLSCAGVGYRPCPAPSAPSSPISIGGGPLLRTSPPALPTDLPLEVALPSRYFDQPSDNHHTVCRTNLATNGTHQSILRWARRRTTLFAAREAIFARVLFRPESESKEENSSDDKSLAVELPVTDEDRPNFSSASFRVSRSFLFECM